MPIVQYSIELKPGKKNGMKSLARVNDIKAIEMTSVK